MTTERDSKKYKIMAELEEEKDSEKLLAVMERLDDYTVAPPAAQTTVDLIASLKPVLREQPVVPPVDRQATVECNGFFLLLRLAKSQVMLLSKWFVAVSAILLLAGLAITSFVEGNTLKYLVNAAPVLGILTVLYEFRAKYSGTAELEEACLYSPAQLAAARLIVVLAYNIVVCLAATPVVSYGTGSVLWQVVVSWLASLLLVLGIALAASLRLGIAGGCLLSALVWIAQLQADKGGSLVALLLPGQPAVLSDGISLTIGTVLLVYSYKRWNLALPQREG